MLNAPPSQLLLSIRRLGPAVDDSDAALLERFVRERDEAAFEAILRRHGDMVRRVCRRHLACDADADDAFQAVFLVLARDAGRIGRRESLAGWLFRVAYHVSRKLMGKAARRRSVPVREDDRAGADHAAEFDREELRAVVEEEVRALPDRFRAPVVLCYLEGRSNTEAALVLGCPRGTVDSRLAAARQKLHARLVRRGVAPAAAAAVAGLWDGEAGAASRLTARTLSAVSQFVRTGSAAGAVSDHVLSLVAGVANTMTTNKLSLLAAVAVGLSLLGGAGFTAYLAADDAKAPPKAEKPKAEKPKAEKPPTAAPVQPPDRADPRPEAGPATDREVMALLRKPAAMQVPEQITVKELLEHLSDRFNVPIRIDLAAFARMRQTQAVQLYEQQVRLPITRGMSVGDVLREALAQLDLAGMDGGSGVSQVTFRIRNGQIAIVPAYVPLTSSVGTPSPDAEAVALPTNLILEQEEGEPITVQFEDKPFTEVLAELRRITGANIVLDAREKEKARLAVAATLNDVRLLAALRVLGDMCDLQPVPMNNVYYLTSRQNAERLQKEQDRRRYGDQQMMQGMPIGPPGVGGFGSGLGGSVGGGLIGGGGSGLGGGVGAGTPGGTPTPPKTEEKK